MCSFRGSYANRGSGTERTSSDAVGAIHEASAQRKRRTIKKRTADPYHPADPPFVIRRILFLPSPENRSDCLKTDGSRFRRYKTRYDRRGRRPRRPGSISE